MGAFLSIGALRFFRSARQGALEWLEDRSLPSISRAAPDVGERSLVKAEAAGGGGRRPAFTRVCSPTDPRLSRSRAEGMSVRGSPFRDARRPVEAHRAFPTAKVCVVVGMNSSSCASIRIGPGQDPGRTPSIAATAAFDVLVLLGAPEDLASGAFCVRARFGFPAVPDPIRGVPL
jgi:hypothetical protein